MVKAPSVVSTVAYHPGSRPAGDSVGETTGAMRAAAPPATAIASRVGTTTRARITLLEGRLLDAVEVRVVLLEERVPLARDAALELSQPLPVLAVELVDDVHPLDDLAERGEALLVETLV